MIKNKQDLEIYLKRDMPYFNALGRKGQFICRITRDPSFEIAKYVRLLRKEEYYYNIQAGFWSDCMYLWYLKRKNSLGNKLGFKIPKNCFGPGLTIYHHGEIIVNEDARIGADCALHGGNCIGNTGKDNSVPIIGDFLDLGVGAKIIGGVKLGDRVRVGANAVVVRSFSENNITLVGIPAHKK